MNKRHFPAFTGALAVTLTAIPVVLFAGIVWWRSPVENAAAVFDEPVDGSQTVAGITESGAENSASVTQQSAPGNPDKAENQAGDLLPVAIAEPQSAESTSVAAVSQESESEVIADSTKEDVPGDSEASVAEATAVDTPSDTSAVVRFPATGSVYQSTGHLALVSQRGDENTGRKKQTQNGKAEGKKSEKSPEMPEVEQADTGEAEDEEKLIEDVLIQSPSVDTPVAQVENLVASTNAKGWPIALVRSDIPEDVWWVQQSVGIQGKSFAARVNFGNRNSLSGSAYKMVIVFLDSPEEVRRFRIAKQFDEIPKGLRRSREFDFVRK